jgi:hypothetical protein
MRLRRPVGRLVREAIRYARVKVRSERLHRISKERNEQVILPVLFVGWIAFPPYTHFMR